VEIVFGKIYVVTSWIRFCHSRSIYSIFVQDLSSRLPGVSSKFGKSKGQDQCDAVRMAVRGIAARPAVMALSTSTSESRGREAICESGSAHILCPM
jgi:hypothetical protein